MESKILSISLCHANCPKCNLPTEFKMFESGAGGDFATYIGETTGKIYRVNMSKVYYQNQELEKLVVPAIENEGGKSKIRQIPEEIKCKICGSIFGTSNIGIDGEESIDAYEL